MSDVASAQSRGAAFRESIRSPPCGWADVQGLPQAPSSLQSVLCSQRPAPLAVPHAGAQELGSTALAGTTVPLGEGGCERQLAWCPRLSGFRLSPAPCCQDCPPHWLSRLSTSLASQNADTPSLPVFPAAPGLSPCWHLHPSLFRHLLWFANPAAVLGEALIQHGAPCQLCQKAETERGTGINHFMIQSRLY